MPSTPTATVAANSFSARSPTRAPPGESTAPAPTSCFRYSKAHLSRALRGIPQQSRSSPGEVESSLKRREGPMHVEVVEDATRVSGHALTGCGESHVCSQPSEALQERPSCLDRPETSGRSSSV